MGHTAVSATQASLVTLWIWQNGATGVQLLGSTAKNIAESCEISPYVTLKEKSTSPYFSDFKSLRSILITVIHLFDCLQLSNIASFRPRRHS